MHSLWSKVRLFLKAAAACKGRKNADTINPITANAGIKTVEELSWCLFVKTILRTVMLAATPRTERTHITVPTTCCVDSDKSPSVDFSLLVLNLVVFTVVKSVLTIPAELKLNKTYHEPCLTFKYNIVVPLI